jgi:Xaa-Pro aminopeptidase
MRYQPIKSKLFKQNRERFVRQMKPDALAIFHSNDQMPRKGDQYFPYTQSPDFFYLTGIEQPESVLVLFPNAPKPAFKEILFIKKSDTKTNIWDGERLSKDEATGISDVKTVYWLDQLPTLLQDLLHHAKRIYVNSNENLSVNAEVETRDMRNARALMQKYPFHKYHRAQPVMRKLRMIKSNPEIEIIQKACEITGKAFQRVLQSTEPGMMEYEVESHITGTFIASGSAGHAYAPIVASGPGACVLHYIKNDQACRDGELLLLDFGAEYAHYASDLTRTIPVNGRFSERQRQVYDAVLRTFKRTREMMVPGAMLDELNKEVGRMMSYELVDLGLLSKDEGDDYEADNAPYRKYFMHGVAHHLGLDVHDLSDKYTPLQAGMVLTCEPGIYIREEAMGIRLENDILVTDDGPIDLMANIPIEAEEIETLMHEQVLS